jgi:hypothetical protein
MFNYDVHEFQINVFINDVVQDFIDQGFVVQDFFSSKQAKDFVVNFFCYSSFSKTNSTLDSWQDITWAKSRIECGFGLNISYILHSIHHHNWKRLSQNFPL